MPATLLAMAHPPAPPLIVDESDLAVLRAIARAPTSEQRAVTRARIVLRSAEGGSIEGIAAELGVAIMTVKLWRRRYTEDGLDGLERSQGDHRHALPFLLPEPGNPTGDGLQGQTRLAHASGANQGQKPAGRVSQTILDPGDLFLTPDKGAKGQG